MDDTSQAIAPVIDTTPTGPTYVTTIDELTATHGAILQKETADKASLLSIFQPSSDELKNKLIIWASLGFPTYWVVYTTRIDPPPACCDGIIRGYYDYILYLLSGSLSPYLSALNTQVPGVSFDFFLKDVNTIGLNVKRI